MYSVHTQILHDPKQVTSAHILKTLHKHIQLSQDPNAGYQWAKILHKHTQLANLKSLKRVSTEQTMKTLHKHCAGACECPHPHTHIHELLVKQNFGISDILLK